MRSYQDFLKEKNETLKQFASNRLKGASDIAEKAKEKGGDALLTYHHFSVKLPYYTEEIEGEFNIEKSQKEFDSLLDELHKKGTSLEQIKFQELVGKIEVLGELIIRNKK